MAFGETLASLADAVIIPANLEKIDSILERCGKICHDLSCRLLMATQSGMIIWSKVRCVGGTVDQVMGHLCVYNDVIHVIVAHSALANPLNSITHTTSTIPHRPEDLQQRLTEVDLDFRIQEVKELRETNSGDKEFLQEEELSLNSCYTLCSRLFDEMEALEDTHNPKQSAIAVRVHEPLEEAETVFMAMRAALSAMKLHLPEKATGDLRKVYRASCNILHSLEDSDATWCSDILKLFHFYWTIFYLELGLTREDKVNALPDRLRDITESPSITYYHLDTGIPACVTICRRGLRHSLYNLILPQITSTRVLEMPSLVARVIPSQRSLLRLLNPSIPRSFTDGLAAASEEAELLRKEDVPQNCQELLVNYVAICNAFTEELTHQKQGDPEKFVTGWLNSQFQYLVNLHWRALLIAGGLLEEDDTTQYGLQCFVDQMKLDLGIDTPGAESGKRE